MFLFFSKKKRNQKKPPVSRGPFGAALRVAEAAGARGNSPALRRAQTVLALVRVRRVDVRRGGREQKTITSKNFFHPPSMGYRRPRVLGKEPHFFLFAVNMNHTF
jgi:hypothetical protein